MSVYQMSARDMYESFAGEAAPQDLIRLGRRAIATKLMIDEGIDEEAAYSAADQILQYAEQICRQRANTDYRFDKNDKRL